MGSNTVSLALCKEYMYVCMYVHIRTKNCNGYIPTYVCTYIPCIHTYVPLLKLHPCTGKYLGLLKQTTVAMLIWKVC